MFTNLVASGSHGPERKRNIAFFAGAVTFYVIVLLAAGLGLLWISDPQVEAQSLESVLVAPVTVREVAPPPKPGPIDKTPKGGKGSQVQHVTEAVAPVNIPLIPDKVGVEASKVPPVTGPYKFAKVNLPGSGVPGLVVHEGTGPIIDTGPGKVDTDPDVPVPPKKVEKPPPIKSGGVINGKAKKLVQPPYPAIARSAHASGQVKVQVVVDEAGNVTSAAPISGHPLLQGAAVAAARASKFHPTTLSGQPVKVSGIIIYNFVER